MQKNKIIRILPHHVSYSINRWPLYLSFIMGLFIGLLIATLLSYFYYKNESLKQHRLDSPAMSSAELTSADELNSKLGTREITQLKRQIDFVLLINPSEPPIHFVATKTDDPSQRAPAHAFTPQNEPSRNRSDPPKASPQSKTSPLSKDPFQQFSTPEPQSKLNLKSKPDAIQHSNSNKGNTQPPAKNTKSPSSSPKPSSKEQKTEQSQSQSNQEYVTALASQSPSKYQSN